ncbi:MAG: hypothetical protein ACI358_06600 [Candidatus Limimorpha sp.]
MKDKTILRITYTVIVFIVIQLIIPLTATAQEKRELRVAFWNFENFFDPFTDSTRTYNEFTENGGQHWTKYRFYRKRNNLYKTLIALSSDKKQDYDNVLSILGIAEVENRYSLESLFYHTPLSRHRYKIVHYEGDDFRGIDVALVYCIDDVQLVYSEVIKLRHPTNKNYKSRDILYTKFSDWENDTIHCFVNHWPSRYGGEMETIEVRSIAAKTLRHKIDSLFTYSNTSPKIIIMGDFNDTPSDASISEVLMAKARLPAEGNGIINLFAVSDDLGFEGTLKHQFNWQIFDQIMISGALMNGEGLRYKNGSATIFHDDFLFQPDDTYGGTKLYRTYVGPQYFGGFSDHLPVYIDLYYR